MEERNESDFVAIPRWLWIQILESLRADTRGQEVATGLSTSSQPMVHSATNRRKEMTKNRV